MPFNPLDMLKRLGSAAVTPMVDEETIAPYQDALDAPALDRSPMEAGLRGFGAGAMEGLRGMTSPLEMGSMALGGAGMAMKGLGRAGAGAARMAQPTLDLIQPQAVRQIAPQMDDVNSLIADMQRNMARVPSKRPPAMDTLGEHAAEFAPRGGEGMFNVGRQASQGAAPYDKYADLMKRGMGGRQR